jgi:hypothetical protein
VEAGALALENIQRRQRVGRRTESAIKLGGNYYGVLAGGLDQSLAFRSLGQGH